MLTNFLCCFKQHIKWGYMKVSILFLLLVFIACSSSPNPITRASEPEKDTVVVRDTILKYETKIETEIILDSIFLVDSFLQIDTLFQEKDLVNDAEQILKCKILLSEYDGSSTLKYKLQIAAALFAVDHGLNNHDYSVKYFRVNGEDVDSYSTSLGLQCVNRALFLEELPDSIHIEVLTSIGLMKGAVGIPTFGRIPPYFKGVKVDSGQYYITTRDSLSLAWNVTADDYYEVTYRFEALDFITGDIQVDYITSRTTATSIVYSNRYFNIYGNAEISKLSVIGYTGEKYGSQNPNVVGDGVGWLNCSAAEPGESKSIFVKYTDPYNEYYLLD